MEDKDKEFSTRERVLVAGKANNKVEDGPIEIPVSTRVNLVVNPESMAAAPE